MFVRKNAYSLTTKEQDNFKNAILKLIKNKTYARYVNIHSPMSRLRMHTDPTGATSQGLNRFLAWHRMYLYYFEKKLGVAIPYWKWTQGKDGYIPSWMQGFTPEISGILRQGATTKTKEKAVRNPFSWTIKQSDINRILSRESFTDFSTALEIPHDTGHGLLGRIMASEISPADPVFWLHHSNVDRIWAEWQKRTVRGKSNLKRVGIITSATNRKRWQIIKIDRTNTSLAYASRKISTFGYKYE